jgi:hypothetical protein
VTHHWHELFIRENRCAVMSSPPVIIAEVPNVTRRDVRRRERAISIRWMPIGVTLTRSDIDRQDPAYGKFKRVADHIVEPTGVENPHDVPAIITVLSWRCGQRLNGWTRNTSK